MSSGSLSSHGRGTVGSQASTEHSESDDGFDDDSSEDSEDELFPVLGMKEHHRLPWRWRTLQWLADFFCCCIVDRCTKRMRQAGPAQIVPVEAVNLDDMSLSPTLFASNGGGRAPLTLSSPPPPAGSQRGFGFMPSGGHATATVAASSTTAGTGFTAGGLPAAARAPTVIRVQPGATSGGGTLGDGGDALNPLSLHANIPSPVAVNIALAASPGGEDAGAAAAGAHRHRRAHEAPTNMWRDVVCRARGKVASRSLLIFPDRHPLRRLFVRITMSRWFERIVLSAPMIDLPGRTTTLPVRTILKALRWIGRGGQYVPGGKTEIVGTGSFMGNPVTSDPVRYARNAAVLEENPQLGLAAPTIAWA
ncbi:hypothetical protein EON62_06130, partial [archaeon]